MAIRWPRDGSLCDESLEPALISSAWIEVELSAETRPGGRGSVGATVASVEDGNGVMPETEFTMGFPIERASSGNVR
jgi:hypothetical protein